MRRIILPWTSVYANTQTPTKLFMPCTIWLNAADVKYLKAVWELISAMANVSIEFAYQTANVENSPDTPAVAVGSAQTSAGVSYGSVTDVSANTNGKKLVRFGFLVTNTSAQALVLGRCGGYVEYKDC
jgi:hypothetical protein